MLARVSSSAVLGDLKLCSDMLGAVLLCMQHQKAVKNLLREAAILPVLQTFLSSPATPPNPHQSNYLPVSAELHMVPRSPMGPVCVTRVPGLFVFTGIGDSCYTSKWSLGKASVRVFGRHIPLSCLYVDIGDCLFTLGAARHQESPQTMTEQYVAHVKQGHMTVSGTKRCFWTMTKFNNFLWCITLA